MRKFAHEGARGSSDESWLQKIFAAQRRELNTAKIEMEFFCYIRAFQRHSGSIPIEPELMFSVFIPRNWKR